MNKFLKNIGRRKAGCWGRPGTKRLKRAASKAARKVKINIEVGKVT